jgi:predicted amidohydrolase YtcJ
VGVRDGRIVASAEGRVHDFGDARILPGFTDAHVHFPSWALSRREVRLHDAASLEEVQARVRAAVDAAAPGRWIRGFGWVAQGWAPSREALDAVSGAVPVALVSRDWHTLWVNSAALAHAGGDLERPGGVVERDAAGEPTGVLRETAAWGFRDAHALPDHAELVEATRAALPEAAARGVVAIHDKDGAIGALDVFRELRDRGELTLRVWQSLPAERMDELAAVPERAEPPGARLRAGYVKAFMDGTLGSGTARLLDPQGSPRGVAVTSREEFAAIVARAAAHRLAVAVHAIGDLAVREALDAFEATAPQWRPRGLRQRIEHAQCVDAADQPRFAALGVTASVQPAMAITDRPLVERLWADRLESAYPYAALHAAGARLAGGSDAPVEALDPLAGMRAARESLDAETTLAAWTSVPAWLAGEEAVRGRLAPGYAADLVVVDRADRVLATMLAGEWVHGPG